MPLRSSGYYESLASLEGGGLPTSAKRRLREEAGPGHKLFTSDLTTNEFLLARQIGIQPISQVMGSSIYHIGRVADYKGATGEIEVISRSHREARQMALTRLRLEATLVEADVVIGVHLGERLITKGAHGKGGDDGDQVIEFTVVGTAARAPWLRNNRGEPVLTDLSGQDVWALHQDGWEPCGMVFEFCRYHVFHVMEGEGNSAGEMKSATDGVEKARQLVADRVQAQARSTHAELVVGSDITVNVHEVPCGYHGCHYNDLDIDVIWYATGIRRMNPADVLHSETRVPPLVLSMMKLGKRKKGGLLDGESDAEALAEQEKEEEEEAEGEEESESE